MTANRSSHDNPHIRQLLSPTERAIVKCLHFALSSTEYREDGGASRE